MDDKILFMIVDDEVKYLTNSDMDHREWYISLGYDNNNFDNLVRGFVMEGKIIFFKGMNFNYDEEVIKIAKKYAQSIRSTLNNPNLEVCCGIVINSYGEKWEPVYTLSEADLNNIAPTEKTVKKEEIKKEVNTRPLIEFKNNYEDPKFIKTAVIISSITLILSIIIKMYLTSKQVYSFSNFVDFLLTIGSSGLLVIIIFGYIRKLQITKYLGIVASICLLLMLDIFDIVLGIIYFIFSIDQGYFTKIINKIKERGAKNV